MGSKPHVIVIPYPAQGHVMPLMKFAYKLAEYGINVTFVNSQFIHGKIMETIPEKLQGKIPISLVSISDGLESDHDRKDRRKVIESISSFMPGNLQNFIEDINRLNNDERKVSCVIADVSVGWALEVAKKMGIKRAAVIPYDLGNLAVQLEVPKLIEAGIIDADGISRKGESNCLNAIPSWNSNDLVWCYPGDLEMQKLVFAHFISKAAETVKISNCLLANSFYEIEPSAFDFISQALPIGPLLATEQLGPFPGNFWPEDSTCLSWLDQQPECSVIYAAFGSTGVCNQMQFNELAFGLEMVGRPFLWVVRSNFTKGLAAEFPDGFLERVENYGKIVEWAPQEKVLAHPSIASFFSHCGWNSTMEGLIMGVPFLCWPCKVDQFNNRSCICETWKVGLGLIPDESGIVTRHQIKTNIEKLLSDKDIKANSMKLKEMARKSISEGGSSFQNFISFIEQIKQ